MAYLWSFLTPELPIVVVADRGFAHASLIRWFLDRQRQFVIRFDGDTWLHLPNGISGAVRDVLPLHPMCQVAVRSPEKPAVLTPRIS